MKTTFWLVLVSLLLTGMASIAAAQTPEVTHNTWSSGTAMPTARQAAFVGAIGKNIYVVGGATNTEIVNVNEIYSTKTNRWTTGASKPTATWAGASAVVNGILYVIGGSDSGSDVLNTVEAYDPVANSWSTNSPMPTARNSMTAVVDKGIVYVIGGFDFSNQRLTTVESYNPATDTWKEEAPLLVGKSGAALGLLGATIVAAGGLSNSGITGDNEAYSASKNKWTALTADPTPRQAGCAWAIAGKLYFGGGTPNGSGGNPLNLLEAYSSRTKSWTTLASMPQPVIGPGSADVGSRLYCFGGSDIGVLFAGTVYDNVQIYQP